MYLLLTIILELICFSKVINSEYDWKVFWENDFEGKQLDLNQWVVEDEPEDLCTGEHIGQQSCHRLANVRINTEQKQLEIHADKNPKTSKNSKPYNTGKLKTIEGWTYGKFEMRAILPEGKLLRPVFLLIPKSNKYNGDWIANGQINGLVYAQKSTFIVSGIHHKKEPNNYAGIQYDTKALITKEFHKYSIEWMPHIIKWYFDDIQYFSYNVSKPFDQEFRIVLQLGVGGPNADFTDQRLTEEDYKSWKNNKFIIDYIRVYKNASEIIKFHKNNIPNLLSQRHFIILSLIIGFCGHRFLN